MATGMGMRCWDRAHLPLCSLPGVTYSDTVSATEPCKPCTQCVGLQSMSAPCVESDDAVCRCAYGYFQDEASGSCRECRVCEVGFGLMFPCKDSQDTVCEECPEGTFSSEANFVDPCLPCTTCEENEVMVKECTAVSDAECRGNAAFPMAEGKAGFTRASASVSLCTAALGRQGLKGGPQCLAEIPALWHCNTELPTKAALTRAIVSLANAQPQGLPSPFQGIPWLSSRQDAAAAAAGAGALPGGFRWPAAVNGAEKFTNPRGCAQRSLSLHRRELGFPMGMNCPEELGKSRRAREGFGVQGKGQSIPLRAPQAAPWQQQQQRRSQPD